MKRKLTATWLFAIAASVPMFAIAQTVSTDTDQPGVTRAQVKADLVNAEREGIVPTTDGDYPPSDRTIERNRELYAITHGEQQSTAVGSAAVSSPPSDQ